MKLRSGLFALLLCLFISGPCGAYFAQHCIGLSVPEWLTSEGAEYLAGGATPSSVRDVATIKGFMEGELQDALEAKLQSSIPSKATALTVNASLQRRVISASNLAFMWPAYPTFFGSSYCFLPEETALVRMPAAGADACIQSAEVFARGLDSVARANGEVDFAVCMADLSSYSLANPARQLVSSPSPTTQDCTTTIRDGVDSRNVVVCDHTFDDPAEYFGRYYTTDHHWSGYGALEAYGRLAQSLGLDATVMKADVDDDLSGLIMNGSSARSGLLLLNEAVKEPAYAIDGLSVEEGFAPPLLQEDGRALLDEEPGIAEFDFYHTWYGPSSYLKIENGAASGAALVVGDSYTSAIQWPIARNYQTTYVYLDAHGSYSGEGSLEDRIRETNCDAVYFVMGPTGLSYLLSCYPNYFAEG